MSGFVDAEEVDVLEEWFAGTARPNTPSHVALWTVAPSDDGTGGTEATGGSYARVAVAPNGTNWGSATPGAPSTIENLLEIAFVEATADWGTIVAMTYQDALTLGNMLFIFDIGTPKDIDSGDTAKFAAGSVLGRMGDPGDTFP